MGPVLTVNVTGRDQMRLLVTAFDGQNSDHNSVSNNSSNIFLYYNHCSSNKLQ
jgi:hypothetical protein